MNNAACGAMMAATLVPPGSVGAQERDIDRLESCRPLGSPHVRVNRDRSGRGSVVVESSQIVFECEEPTNFPGVTRYADGTIWLNFIIGLEATPAERPHQVLSRDNGATWEQPATAFDRNSITRACVLPDGSILSIPGWPAAGPPASGSTYQFTVNRFRTPQSPPEVAQATVELPFQLEPGYGTGGNLCLCDLLALDNGDVLASAYGSVIGERYRSYIIKSSDQGKTWTYLSTIAHDGAGAVVTGREGPCEPGWSTTADGGIFCLMRTGGPLWQARSRDHGKTWEALPPLEDQVGTYPRVMLMSNGVLVAAFGSYRRQMKDEPNILLLVDYDGTGEKWDAQFVLYKGPGTGYTCMVEVEPGLLMFIYDESQFTDGKTVGWYPLNRIMAA